MLTSKDLMLSVGQKTMASIHGVKYEIYVWGWKDKEFIITDAPRASGNYLRMASMTGIRIRFIKDGCAIVFDTRVIVSHPQPPPYMLLEFPQTLDKDIMRKYERYKIKLPITLRKKDGVPFAGMIYDIGLGGVLVAHENPLAVGEVVFLDVEWKELCASLADLESTVQNVRENVQAMKGLYLSGLMFWNDSAKNQQALQKIIDYLSSQDK